MSRFLDDARAIFEAAESASESGQCVSDFTMLIGQDGAIQMLAASDWSLDRLLAERGARAAYRVGETNGRIHLEARTAGRSCRLESEPPQAVARKLLGPFHSSPVAHVAHALACGAGIRADSGSTEARALPFESHSASRASQISCSAHDRYGD